MKLIFYIFAMSMWLISMSQVYSQETEIIYESNESIEFLEQAKQKIIDQEKEALKAEVETIANRLSENQISSEEAEQLKKEVAQKRASNIENRLAIIDNKIALLERNKGNDSSKEDDEYIIRIGMSGNDDDQNSIFYIGKKHTKRPYDRRTTSGLIIAGGFNLVNIEGQSIGDSPYKILGSGFTELGLAWNTRLLQNSNFVRLKYGLSLQWNRFELKGNNYFVENGKVTSIEEFSQDLKKAELRLTNLIVPVHFEFGPSKKIEKEDYFRYDTTNQFKFGLGGYAGLNLGTQQKLKYTEDGERVKQKIKRDYNATNFVYGLSGYIGFDCLSLYGKYELSRLFENQAIPQNSFALALRVDLN